MPYANYSPEEVASRGEHLYWSQIHSTLSKSDEGKFVVIDIETGDFEVDEEDLAATDRMLSKRPDSVLYGIRIGYPAAYRLGVRAVARPR